MSLRINYLINLKAVLNVSYGGSTGLSRIYDPTEVFAAEKLNYLEKLRENIINQERSSDFKI